MFLSQPRSKFLVSLSISTFLSTLTSQLSLNPVSITFVLFATFGQVWMKTQQISLPALLSFPGLTMQTRVCSAALSRIYLAYRWIKTLLLVSSHALTLGPALPICWYISTGFQYLLAFSSRLPYLLLSHSTPLPHLTCHPSSDPMFFCASAALPVLIDFAFHTSAPFLARGVSDRPDHQSEIPYHYQLLLVQPHFQETAQDAKFSSAFPSSWICPRCASDSMISIYFFIWLS